MSVTPVAVASSSDISNTIGDNSSRNSPVTDGHNAAHDGGLRGRCSCRDPHHLQPPRAAPGSRRAVAARGVAYRAPNTSVWRAGPIGRAAKQGRLSSLWLCGYVVWGPAAERRGRAVDGQQDLGEARLRSS